MDIESIDPRKLENGDRLAEAWYRISGDFKDFLEKVDEKHEIAGFVYKGGFDFGILIKKPDEDN